MSTIPSVNFLAQTPLVPLPTTERNAFEFVFREQPFVKGSEIWKATPKHLQKHVLPGPIPEEKPIFRDGLKGMYPLLWSEQRGALVTVWGLSVGPSPLHELTQGANHR